MTVSPKSPPVVSFSELEVGYGRHVILHDISSSVSKGECVALTGNNGSGKSTLVKALMGIEPFQRGTISLFKYVRSAERPPVGPPPWSKLGYVPQRLSATGGVESSVFEVVQSGLLGYRALWPKRGSKAKVMDTLDRVGLTHRSKEPFAILSGGQQQRVLIARALVRDPELLVLDEPLTGLDRHNRERLAQIISDQKDRGTTSLIVLHELGELGPLITRELRLSYGHLVHDGPCDHVSHQDISAPWFDHAPEPSLEGSEL